MPPKQQPKADLAKKQKQVEDKTFGLKNKNKSKNVQKYVQSLKQSVQPKPDATKAAAKVHSWILKWVLSFLDEFEVSSIVELDVLNMSNEWVREMNLFWWGQKKKEEEKAREQELNELFKVAISQPKVPVGMYVVVDTVSLVCSLLFR